MNIQRIISIGSLIAAGTFAALWQQEKNLNLESSGMDTLVPYRSVAHTLMNDRSKYEADIARINESRVQTTDLLRQVNVALAETQERITYLEFGGFGRRVLAEERAREISGVHSRTNRIAKVISPEGGIYIENASFSSRKGGRIYFRTAKGPKGFHMDELHPVVLRGLGLDPQKLREEDEAWNNARARQRAQTMEAIRRGTIETQQILAQMKANKDRQAIADRQAAQAREEMQARERRMDMEFQERQRQALANEEIQRQRAAADYQRSISDQLLLQRQLQQQQYPINNPQPTPIRITPPVRIPQSTPSLATASQ
tara:strand:+ start:428 stop:1369 length:942 start_codon:yes stop_codon:yes gene_type:complete